MAAIMTTNGGTVIEALPPPEVENLAKKLYSKHMDFHGSLPYMWLQCSTTYRNAWRTIAEAELE